MTDETPNPGERQSSSYESQIAALKKRVQSLEAEAVESDELRQQLAELLTGVANAVNGPPRPNWTHSWHDLPERVAALVANLTPTQKEFHDMTARASAAESLIGAAWEYIPEHARQLCQMVDAYENPDIHNAVMELSSDWNDAETNLEEAREAIERAATLLRERPRIGGDEYENQADEWLAEHDSPF